MSAAHSRIQTPDGLKRRRKYPLPRAAASRLLPRFARTPGGHSCGAWRPPARDSARRFSCADREPFDNRIPRRCGCPSPGTEPRDGPTIEHKWDASRLRKPSVRAPLRCNTSQLPSNCQAPFPDSRGPSSWWRRWDAWGRWSCAKHPARWRNHLRPGGTCRGDGSCPRDSPAAFHTPAARGSWRRCGIRKWRAPVRTSRPIFRSYLHRCK